MTEITKYLADDGTEFEDKDECLDYERKQKLGDLKGLKFYDSDFNELTIDQAENCEQLISDAYYIKCTDGNDLDNFKEVLDEEYCGWSGFDCAGWRNVDREGLFFFDKDSDCWMSWDEWYDKLRDIRKKLNY